MPKNLLKRYLPSPGEIKRYRSLQFLGRLLQDGNLWHMNRRSVSLAAFVGGVSAFLPVPSQMVIAAVIAVWLRCNLPIAVATVWISNPLTIPPLFYFAYRVGAWMLDRPRHALNIDLSFEWLAAQFAVIWQPLLLGSLVCGLLLGGVLFAGVRIAWRVHVVLQWRRRKNRHLPS